MIDNSQYLTPSNNTRILGLGGVPTHKVEFPQLTKPASQAMATQILKYTIPPKSAGSVDKLFKRKLRKQKHCVQ